MVCRWCNSDFMCQQSQDNRDGKVKSRSRGQGTKWRMLLGQSRIVKFANRRPEQDIRFELSDLM